MATTIKPEAKAVVKEGEVAPEVADLIPEKGSLILSVTENGYGKRTPADEYRLTNRGGKGVINVKTTERNGKVVGISQVSEKSEVMLISQYGRSASTARSSALSRSSSANRDARLREYGC